MDLPFVNRNQAAHGQAALHGQFRTNWFSKKKQSIISEILVCFPSFSDSVIIDGILTSPRLASYTYNTNGTMATMTYPNGDYVAYGYDTFDRLVSEMYYNSNNVLQVEYRYVYNAEGKLAKQYEVRGNTTQTYTFKETNWCRSLLCGLR